MKRILRRTGAILFFVVLAAIVGFVLYAESPMRAESAPLAAVTESYEQTDAGVVITPDDPDGTGLVFIAGARVDPLAYVAKLAPLADSGVTVVIVRPVLNFAILEYRPLDDFEVAGVDTWYVGGHSLGGVKACQYAADASNDVAGLILFGSYCASDISDTDLPVLTLSASNDGLSTPAKIEDAAGLLPSDAETVTLPGAVHAQFGDYGAQPGDGSPTATDDEVSAEITAAVLAFLKG